MSEEQLPPSALPAEPAGLPESAPAHEDGLEPAGFWVRAGAASIDGLVIFAALFVIAFAGILIRGADNPPVGLIRFAALVLSAGYYTALTGFSGQTIGKMAAGIQVLTAEGGHVSYARSLGRWAGYFLSSITLGIGYAMAGFTKGKRALHDKVAGTRVVYLPQTTHLRRRVMAGLGAISLAGIFVAAVLAGLGASRLAGGVQQEWVQEASAVANVQALRSLVDQYKAKFGDYPAALDDLKKLDGFTGLPEISVGGHPATKDVEVYQGLTQTVNGQPQLDASKLKDTGKWGYVAGTDAYRGHVFIDCTHQDSQSKSWYQY